MALLLEHESRDFLNWVVKKIGESKANRKGGERIRNHESYCLAILDRERGNFRAETAMGKEVEPEQAPRVAGRILKQWKKTSYDRWLNEVAWQRWEEVDSQKLLLQRFRRWLRDEIREANPYYQDMEVRLDGASELNRVARIGLIEFLVEYWDLRSCCPIEMFFKKKEITWEGTEEQGYLVFSKGEPIAPEV